MTNQETGRQELLTPQPDQTGVAAQARHQAYETPEIHELGTLAKVQQYGFNYNDGKRYKDD